MAVREDVSRCLRGITAGRGKWKRRAGEKQKTIRYLRVRVRDLEESRELWKRRAIKAELTRGPLPADSIDLDPSATLSSNGFLQVRDGVAPDSSDLATSTALSSAAATPVDDCPLGEV